MKIRYAVNIVSLMHLGWQNPFKRGVGLPGMVFAPAQRLIDMALEVGYDGVQMLPVRGATGLESGILLFENAWNAVWGPIQALRHGTGMAGLPSGLKDWVVSPNPNVCAEVVVRLSAKGVPQITHDMGMPPNNGAIEVHPDLDLSADEIAARCEQDGPRLALDTLHLRRDRRDGAPSPLFDKVVGWKPAFEMLSPYARVIHVNDTDPALKANTVEWVVFTLKKAAEAGVQEMTLVAEYTPPRMGICTPAEARAWAIAYRDQLRIVACTALDQPH